jgi:hypothetical protein
VWCTPIAVIDERNAIVYSRFDVETDRAVPQGVCLRYLLRQSTAFDEAGEFDRRLPVTQNYLYWINVALRGSNIGYLKGALGKYRGRKRSLMANSKRLLAYFADRRHVLTRAGHREISW